MDIHAETIAVSVAEQGEEVKSVVFLPEALPKLAMGASSRNTGVIHSGLYFAPGSLKARQFVHRNRSRQRRQGHACDRRAANLAREPLVVGGNPLLN